MLSKLTYLTLSNMKLQDEWDFIEMYYPDYQHSDEILENDLLFSLHSGDYEPDSGAEELLNEAYGGDIKNPQIEIDYNVSCKFIFQKAIVAYVESLNASPSKLFEITLRGYNGATDETDNRVLWIAADDPEKVKQLSDLLDGCFCGETPHDISVADLILTSNFNPKHE